MERIHTHGEQLLRPLRLSDAEVDDLVAFLETLTGAAARAGPAPAAATGCERAVSGRGGGRRRDAQRIHKSGWRFGHYMRS
jgi:hypothetical protein